MGTILGGDFRVVRPLKHGGLGAVYMAEQVSTSEQRALEVMHATLPGMNTPERVEKYRSRFLDEARKSVNIRSAHVVTTEEIAEAAIWHLTLEGLEIREGATIDVLRGPRSVIDALAERH